MIYAVYLFILLVFVGMAFIYRMRKDSKKIESLSLQIQQLQKTRTDFVANVSHELKTPLTSIKGYTETLSNSKLQDKEQSLKFLKKIEENTDRLDALIHDILDLSRLEATDTELNYESISVEGFLQNLKEQFAIRLEKKSQSLKISSDVEVFFADKKLAEQALSNLVGNANRYCPESAEIEIRVHPDVLDGRDMICFEILDNGPGISKEDLPRIFERFYRADKSRNRALGGTGLGLAIVKHILLSHRGKAVADLRPEGGMGFKLYFPKSPAARGS